MAPNVRLYEIIIFLTKSWLFFLFSGNDTSHLIEIRYGYKYVHVCVSVSPQGELIYSLFLVEYQIFSIFTPTLKPEYRNWMNFFERRKYLSLRLHPPSIHLNINIQPFLYCIPFYCSRSYSESTPEFQFYISELKYVCIFYLPVMKIQVSAFYLWGKHIRIPGKSRKNLSWFLKWIVRDGRGFSVQSDTERVKTPINAHKLQFLLTSVSIRANCGI